MIQELVALAANLRQSKLKGSYIHDALDKVPILIDCVIDRKGKFKQFIVHDSFNTVAEAITAKKGKARLLVDKPEEILSYGKNAKSKHRLFLDKIKDYSHLSSLKPVVSFYNSNKANGFQKARSAFPQQVEEKLRNGNIAFILPDSKKRLHEERDLYKAIIEKYKSIQVKIKSIRFSVCSICGSSEYAVVDLPHGMIKRIPDGQTAGCALVSFNDTAYESYELSGNENSSICTHCARSYVDALNWLLSNGKLSHNKKGKEIFLYKNRKNISDDTAVIFWLQEAVETTDLDLLDEPDEGKIREMIESIESGKSTPVKNVNSDKFYAITLSGAAARIAIRDWIETSLTNLRENLIQWFKDIETAEYDKDEGRIVNHYPRFWELVKAAKSKSTNDVKHGRIGAVLWKCAIKGTSPPLWILSAVLNRIRAEQGNTTSERIALLKLFMNRRMNQQGGTKYMSDLDESNKNIAYICGRIFAVLESIQYHASGGNLNAGIRERFFSFASTMPSTAFGRLMKLSQHHLSKIRGEKPGLAVILDKKISELMCSVESTRFPVTFSLEDQASFTIGYYHQRQKDFDTKSNNKEN
jgi:CRISPR-associated protein Csd1